MITATVLTKNNAETLENTLDSLKSFPEVIVYDTGSTDATLEVAKRFSNVKVIEGSLKEGFGPTHNLASSFASNDWVLSVDSDEVLSSTLTKEIFKLSLDPFCVYEIQRRNFFNKKWIKGCGGWYPDPVVRLYNRQTTRFSDDIVHEKVLTDNLGVVALNSPLLHTPYRTIDDFLSKMQLYSTLFAKQQQEKKKSSLTKALIRSIAAFFKSYFLKRGFLDGKEGFIISLYNSQTTFYKYLKLVSWYR